MPHYLSYFPLSLNTYLASSPPLSPATFPSLPACTGETEGNRATGVAYHCCARLETHKLGTAPEGGEEPKMLVVITRRGGK